MRIFLTVFIVLISIGGLFSQQTYKFDMTANVYGCSNILLQKVSKDWQYELMIEINQIDSLPISKEFNLTKNSKFVTVYLNKFPQGNNYIQDICNDFFFKPKKVYKPDKFVLNNGTLFISRWNRKDFIISLYLKDAIFKNDSNKQIQLPFEQFNHLTVGWKGG